LEEFRHDLQLLRAALESIEGLISKHHFALRETDIATAQKCVSAIAELRQELIDKQQVTLGTFEGMLSTHLDGSRTLDQRLPPQLYLGTRYDLMVINGKAAAENLQTFRSGHLEHTANLVIQLKN
jgi:hypothetical protein